MARIIILINLFLSMAVFCHAQKEDYSWILGARPAPDSTRAMVRLNFNTDPVSIEYIDKRIALDLVSSSLSDTAGNLICMSNCANIYNNNFDIIENGNDIQPPNTYPWGLPVPQGMIILPVGKGSSEYLLLTGNVETFIQDIDIKLYPIFYIRFSMSDTEQKVIEKKSILADTMSTHGMFTAVRHANGRDWWLTLLKRNSNKYYKVLVNDGVPMVYGTQVIGDSIPHGVDHTVFSPDGNWYARYSWWGTTSHPHARLYLYNFDRCSGALSNFRKYDFKDDGPGSVAISPNSKYLYASNWDTIFQYDLSAPDIFASETVVAGYDGFVGEDGRKPRFFTPQLAPDGRIYLCVPNTSSRYLHYIAYPDSAGKSCNVVQHGIKLPVYNSNTLPNLPYFRLYNDSRGICDTIGQWQPPVYAMLQILPNPGNEAVRLVLPGNGLSHAGIIQLFSATGALALEAIIPPNMREFRLETSALASGVYFFEIKTGGKLLGRGKWVKHL
jgi:hypothetical protein